jgi:hypothetical protein
MNTELKGQGFPAMKQLCRGTNLPKGQANPPNAFKNSFRLVIMPYYFHHAVRHQFLPLQLHDFIDNIYEP